MAAAIHNSSGNDVDAEKIGGGEEEVVVVGTQVTGPTSDVSESGGEQHHDDEPTLPFSKARCIALVATVTGASFLNVRMKTFSFTLSRRLFFFSFLFFFFIADHRK